MRKRRMFEDGDGDEEEEDRDASWLGDGGLRPGGGGEAGGASAATEEDDDEVARGLDRRGDMAGYPGFDDAKGTARADSKRGALAMDGQRVAASGRAEAAVEAHSVIDGSTCA